jgi:formiminotetrahydrofolate cyclodeaminase
MTESLESFSARVAAATPAPAGGSVAAISASLAAALVEMVGRIGQARQKPGADPASLAHLVQQADQLRTRLLALAEEDSNAYLAVLEAKRSTAGGEADRDARIRAAWRHAAQVPADVIRLSRDVAQLARRAAREGPPSTLGDAVMAALVAAAAAAGSMVNLRLNVLAADRPADLRILEDDTTILLRDAERAAMETRTLAEDRLAKKEVG